MFAKAKSQGLSGLNGFDVIVEADLSSGLPRFDIVGLPDAAVKESRERVRASIKNCGYDFPVSRITVNIAPGYIKKEGPVYDLPIFIAILKASGQIKNDISDYCFIGELSLDGQLRSSTGILTMGLKAKESGVGAVFIPYANRVEGSVVKGIDVLPDNNVKEIIDHLSGFSTVNCAFQD